MTTHTSMIKPQQATNSSICPRLDANARSKRSILKRMWALRRSVCVQDRANNAVSNDEV